MATWGAYFSSYVKKTSDAKQVELAEISEKELLGQTSEASSRIESISSQQSNSSAKKLYDITSERTNQPFQRSNSNAARVAMMFGFGTPAPPAEVEVQNTVAHSVAPLATWTKIESNLVQAVPPLEARSKAESEMVPAASPPEINEAESTKLRGTSRKPQSKRDIFAMLDDFANMADNPDAIQSVKSPTTPPKPKSKQDFFAMLDDFANMADNPDAIQILPEKKPIIAEIRMQKKGAVLEATKIDPISIRKDLFRSQISPLLSRPKLVASKNPQTEPSEDFRARMLEFDRKSEELKLERKKRDEERDQILKYERMSEQMRIEREKMEIEKERMLAEQMKFQAEADRIAEEERQMEQFMKDFQTEIERDRENEDKKRRALEDAEREKQMAIEAAQEAEYEALSERERATEAEERRKREQEAEERELREFQARRAARQKDAEDKERRNRLKDERLAQEEADRRTAKLREADEADRLQFEYAAELEAKRQRFEENEAELKRQRLREERIAAQRRAEKERAERAQYEEDESRRRAQEAADRRFSAERRREQDQESESDDDRPLTKEEELKKAEEKIRQAFAQLAKERGQEVPALQRSNTVAIQMPRSVQPVKNLARGINPAVGESRVYKGDPEVQRSDKGFSRYNTVGARPQQQEKPGILQKPLRLSSGGAGLPAGPRSGLPAGPRRNRTVQRF